MRNISSLGQARDYGDRLSKLLKKYRELANFRLTQSDLANRVGVSARSIRDWETGINLPTARNLKKIIEVYHKLGLFTARKEREEAEELWILRQGKDLSNTFPLFDVSWLENAPSASSDPEDKADIQSPDPTSIAEPAKNVTPFPAKLISGNLPQLLSSFIGRDKELAEIQRLLQTTRLLTITGTGGAGKTRLSQEVAHRLQETASDRFPDGIWWVELTPMTDPHHLVQSILSTLLPDRRQEGDLYELLQKFLQPKKLLVVLDNCEHLVEAVAALVQKLLRDCTSLQILATSREKLNLTGEQTWLLEGLSVPGQQTRQGEDLAGSAAVQLFVDRARAADLLFELNSENAGAVLSICRQLDGLPLAIELAAARVRVLGVEQIARRLQQNLKLLSDGSRANLPHHQTIQAMIDWSYNLLSAEEQLLLRRMAVFRGDFSLEAAEGVLGGDAGPGSERLDPDDVLILLLQLVNKSLVVAVASENNTETRYRLLEMVRQYNQEKLEESLEAVYLSYKHCTYFTDFAEKGHPNYLSERSAKWVERLNQDVANLRAALTWALNSSQSQGQVALENPAVLPGELLLRLSAGIGRFWQMKSYINEGKRWLEAGLALEELAQRADLKAVRAWAYFYLGFFTVIVSPDQAISYQKLSLTLFEELGDKVSLVAVLSDLASAHTYKGNVVEAKSFLLRSLALVQEIENKFHLGYILLLLGWIATVQGNLDEALAFFQKCDPIFHLQNDDYGLAYIQIYLAVISRIKQDLPQSLRQTEEGLQMLRGMGNKIGTAYALTFLSTIHYNLQNYRQAYLKAEEATTICEKEDIPYVLVYAQNNLAKIQIKQGNLAEVRRLGRQSLEIIQKNGDKLAILETLHTFALLAAALEDWSEFAWLYAAAETLRQQLTISHEYQNEQPILDRLYEQSSSHLDPATLDRLRVKGQTNSLDEIVKQVLA